VPPDAPDRFAGEETATGAPRLVYPADGVLLPPNLRELELHFIPGSGAGTVFEISFRGRFVEARLYVLCRVLGAGCQTVLPDAVWALLAANERGADPVPYAIRSVRPGSTAVAAGSGQTLAFAEEEIAGGLYYWNASRGSIQRYEFGLRGAFPEDYLDPARAGAFSCVGCHTLSRDGSRIAVGLDEPIAPPYRVFDVATRSVMFSIGSSGRADGAGFYTFSPDARQVMAAENGGVYLRDSDSGAPLARIVEMGTMPDWSPSGERIVYALPPCTDPMFCGFDIVGASLETAVWDGTMWSPGPELVPFTGANNYYPTFSPDGGWVMFNRSPSNASSFGAPDGQVWVVDADGGDPIALGTAQGPGDSWPKWDPSLYMHRGHPLFWFTFSSRKPVGVRPGGGFGPFGEQSQLWMAAFDPSRAEAGDDPAFPAFWLPFQDPSGGNHIAQWVTRVERMPCEMDAECESGEVCREGVCVPDLI
jgi:hypothetical protein